MKFSCNRNKLVQAVQTVAKAVSNKPKTPIISGIYIKTMDNSIELQATDFELSIICRVEAQIDVPGEIVVSGRYLQEAIRRLPGENVSFSIENTNSNDDGLVVIKSNKSTFNLLSMNPADFPELSKVEAKLQFEVRDNILRELIAKTSFSCSNDDSRPVFTGCLLEVSKGSIVMAATNTHRLSIKSDVLEEFDGNRRVIIPAKVLNELLHSLSSELPRMVTISCGENLIGFEFDEMYISSRIIEGSFPDYHRVVPLDFNVRVELDTQEFRDAVERTALISNSQINFIKLSFANGQVMLSSNNPEIGRVEDYVSATIDGEDITIAFNARYLSDALKVINTDKFYFSLNGTMMPAAIRQYEDESFTYIITPVRTE